MGLFENLLSHKKEADQPKRRAKKIKSEGKLEERKKKQNVNSSGLFTANTFTVLSKFFAIVLFLAVVAAVIYFIYLGLDLVIDFDQLLGDE